MAKTTGNGKKRRRRRATPLKWEIPPEILRWQGLVSEDKSLSGEAKWMWAYLWELAGRRARIVGIRYLDVARFFGRQTERSPTRWIEQLEMHGAVERRGKKNGVHLILVRDPAHLEAEQHQVVEMLAG